MNSKASQYLLITIFALTLFAVKDYWLGVKIQDAHRDLMLQEMDARTTGKKFDKNYISTQTLFTKMTLGFEQLLSDYYWIKVTTLGAVDMMHKYKISPDNKRAAELLHHTGASEQEKKTIYELVQMSTSYDPHFIYAYEFGSLVLAWEGYTDYGHMILEKGIKNNPDSAKLYNSMSFMHFFFLKDFEGGAEFAQKAYDSSEDGTYANPKLVAQAYAAGGDYEAALKFLIELAEHPDGQMTKGQIDNMIAYITVERDIEFLQESLDRFIKKYNVRPMKLDGLVKANIIYGLPTEPFGGTYILNTTTWKVENAPPKRYEHLQVIRDMKRGDEAYHPLLREHEDGEDHSLHDEDNDEHPH